MAEVTQAVSSFAQSPLVGEQDWTVNNNIVAVRFNPNSVSTSPAVAGQAFKLITGASGVPLVDIVTAVTDTPYGVAVHTLKRDTFLPGEYFDLAINGSVLYMQSSAAIARGVKVQIDPTGPTVATLTNLPTNASLGIALDVAAGANALIRVSIQPLDPNLSAY